MDDFYEPQEHGGESWSGEYDGKVGDQQSEMDGWEQESWAGQDAVPHRYGEFALPDGFEPLPELAESFGELARDLGLSQGKAQMAVDFFAEYQKQQQADFVARQDEFIEQLKSECMKDAEIGGARWQGEAQVSVRLALDKLGTPALKRVIQENPALAVHPEIVRFFKRAGDLLREGRPVNARAGVETSSAANVLFDKSVGR